ncbi:trimethyllysine dioxygenase, mitochondrial isoform X6 [Pongo pygmaeus]|uniref:trimethyllysine dioxygenase, mitochondrial isoform X6 n=1 Tax=Pongo pygmaeus TaxID=9600 RepID=UPI00300C365D
MWYHRLSHLHGRLQDLLKGGVIYPALPQPNFKSLLPLAVHWHHTASKSLTCAWQQHEDHFELKYANTVMRFDYVWLRDHCRSASCYNSKTHQRSLDTASVDLCIKPKTIRLDETTLFFTWPDGHVTKYDLNWLVKNSYEGQKQKVIQPRILWNAEIYQQAQVPSVDCQSFLETNEGLKKFLQNFLLYGIAFVENVPPTQEHTEKLAERISLIRETIYGRMWYFTSDFSRGDTAYTKLALDRHTDTTYFQEPCGLYRKHNSIFFWGGLRELPVMVEGEWGANSSHGKNRSKRERVREEVPHTFKQLALTGTHSLSEDSTKPSVIHLHDLNTSTRPYLQHWRLQFNMRFWWG